MYKIQGRHDLVAVDVGAEATVVEALLSPSSFLLSSLELSDTQSLCALNASPPRNRITFLVLKYLVAVDIGAEAAVVEALHLRAVRLRRELRLQRHCRVLPFKCRVSLFKRRVSPFKCRVLPFKCRVSPFKRRVSPFERRVSPCKCRGSPFKCRCTFEPCACVENSVSSATAVLRHLIDSGLVGWLKRISLLDHCLVFLGGGTQDKKMSKGHLPRVVYHQVYNVYFEPCACVENSVSSATATDRFRGTV